MSVVIIIVVLKKARHNPNAGEAEMGESLRLTGQPSCLARFRPMRETLR